MTLKTALIVDDSKLARITLKKKLESLGLQVEMVESAEQAFKHLLEQQPDILFMDHLMPGIDGFEATQKIRQTLTLHDLPIVMCTGKDHDGYLEEALAIGANYILSKPPADEALDAILKADHTAVVDDIPTLAFEEIVPVVTAVSAPILQAGLSRDEVQLLCEEMLLANKAGFIQEALAQMPKMEAPTVEAPVLDVAAIIASVKNDVIQQVLVSLPTVETVVQDNASSLDMESLLSTVNASVNHQLAVNAGSMKTALIDQVQSQLNEIITARVTQMLEHDIQGILDLRLSVTLAEKMASTQQQLDALQAHIEELASGLSVSNDSFGEIAPATKISSSNNTQLLEKAFQSQVQMQEEIEALKKTSMIAMGVAALAVVVAIVAIII